MKGLAGQIAAIVNRKISHLNGKISHLNEIFSTIDIEI